jgi:hypothetical protein
LVSLNLNTNQLKTLPASFTCLTKLEHLSIFGADKEWSTNKYLDLTPEQERFINQIKLKYWMGWAKAASSEIKNLDK